MEKSKKVQESLEWYQNNRDRYKRLALKVELIIKEILEHQGIAYHSVSSRAKDLDSFAEKSAKEKYKNPRDEIKDLAGIRVIAYVEADLQKICNVIEREFIIYPEDSGDKSIDLAINQVGYRSIHYIAELSKSRIKLPEFKRFTHMCFEIQVRTILQHAWAEIEHDRSYKFKGILPNQNSIKRRFALLAGLLEVADREFDTIVSDIDSYSEDVAESTSEGRLDMEINSISLHEYLNQKCKPLFQEGVIEDYRYYENSENIIEELSKFGINNISELDQLISNELFDVIISEMNSSQEVMNFIGLLRSIMMVSDYKKYFEKAWKNGWQYMNDVTANILLKYSIPVEDILEKYRISSNLFNRIYNDEYQEND